MCCLNIHRFFFFGHIIDIPVCQAVEIHVELMTFKNKSPGSDENTWDKAIVGVKYHTHYSNTMSKCLYLIFAQAPDRG